MNTEKLYVKFLHPKAKLPQRSSSGAAGYDLYAVEDGEISPNSDGMVKTGIAVQIPEGLYGRVASRSGLSVRHKIEVGAGTIDNDYVGEVKIHLYNFSSDFTFRYQAGDRVAQLILEKISTPPVVAVEELAPSVRGDGGFGSTGK